MRSKRIACLVVVVCMSISCLNSVFAVQTESALEMTETTAEKIVFSPNAEEREGDASASKTKTEDTEEADGMKSDIETEEQESEENELTALEGLSVQAAPAAALAAEPENILIIDPSDPPSVQKYQEFSYYDPQWVTDEALFGKWDGSKWLPQVLQNGTPAGGTTTVEGPLLKYDLEKYADVMRPIEAAAKKGDYATCKELLLEHYRQKFSLLEPLRGSSSRSTWVNAQTLIYNLTGHANGTASPIEILEVGNKTDWYSTDITNSVTNIGKNTATSKGLFSLMVALRRDGYRAIFDSKESGNAPYIEVELSDGRVKKFTAQFDAYISPGSNSGKKYGGESTIQVEESVTSATADNNVDSNTARGYLRFDMGDLTPQDEVRSARLYLRGSSNHSDASYMKQICIYELGYGNSENEATFDWNSIDHTVMSDDLEDTYDNLTGFPAEGFVDNVYQNIARITGPISSAIDLYLATDNEEYAYHAIRTILGVCMQRGMIGNPEDTGTRWPYHNKLSLGNRGQIYQNRLRGLINSKYMTPDVFACLLKLAWTTGEQLEYCWTLSQETSSNWGNTQATALFNMALYFDEFEDCHKPLQDYDYQPDSMGKSGGWMNLAAYRLTLKGSEIIFSDGSCREIPMGYADYALNGFVSAYNMAVNANMADAFPHEVIESMETLIEYLIFMSAPDGSGYSQGNGEEHFKNQPLARAQWLKDMTDNPIIKWYASGRTEGTPPKETSKIYPIGLKYISKGGWGTDAVGSHFNADGGCNVHGHADDLSFDLFAYGEHLIVDNGTYTYTDNPIRAWQISTRGHNTIEINGISQNTPKWAMGSVFDDPFGKGTIYLPDYSDLPMDSEGRKLVPGYFMNTELNNGYDYVRGGSNGNKNRKIASKNLTFDDYTYERSVFFVRPDFYLITDYIDPLTNKTEVNTYDQRWHTMPGVTINIDQATGQVRTSGQNASVIITPVAQKDPVSVSVGQGYYTATEGSAIENQHALYTKKVAGTTTMNTVIYPVAPGKDFDVVTQNIELSVPESTANAFSATITDNKTGNVELVTKYEKHTGRDVQVQQPFGNYSTDGYLAVIDETNGKLTSAAMQGGTNLLNRDGNHLIFSKNKIEGLSVTWKNGQMELNTGKTVVHSKANVDTDTEIDVDALTVYVPDYITDVTLNGEQISFKRAGSYIYFGAEPLLSEGEEPEQGGNSGESGKPGGSNNNTSSGPSHGSSGSAGGSGNGNTTPIALGNPTGENPSNSNFSDEIKGHWAELEISSLLENSIVKGDGGRLNLTAQVTRAEFAAMITRALKMEETVYQGGLQDVSADDWFAGIIQTCMDKGIMQGSDGMMRPNDPITREEMAKIIVSVSKEENSSVERVSFTDSSSISEWANEYVNQAVSLGLLNGFEDGSFRPLDATLREQAMVVIYRLLHLK